MYTYFLKRYFVIKFAEILYYYENKFLTSLHYDTIHKVTFEIF